MFPRIPAFVSCVFATFFVLVVGVSASSRGLSSQRKNGPRYASFETVLKRFGAKISLSANEKMSFPYGRLMRQAAATPSPSPRPSVYGFTFDPCFYHKDCIGGRLCIRGDMEAACSGAANCFCLAEATQLCNSCKECEFYPNESCVKQVEDTHNEGLCASTYTVYEGILVEIGCNTYPNVTPLPPDAGSDSRNPTNGSDTYAPGTSPSAVPATPIPSQSSSPLPSDSSSPSPAAPAPASGSEEEGNSSASSSTTPGATPGSGSTVQNSGDNSPSDSCFDAHAMQHMSMSQLVFPSHRLAGVLCDAYGSCATPSHMVIYQNLPMTMLRYCSMVHGRCSKRVIHVNSPRYLRALRVESSTPELYYTAFAAKYGTAFEERALRMAVRAGL